jgi:uncharacterized pyridoxamine 5'-phosphate oxidase family protein
VHESEEDLLDLQRLLDSSQAAAGDHLRSIFTEERRVPAAELPAMLAGVQVLSLATVTPAGEPRVAPVDSLFFRGRFWFGSSDRSLRFRNIRARPAVSGAVTRGERFAVIVHGAAREVDIAAPESEPFRNYCVEVYGEDWTDWGAGAAYALIEPARMFTLAVRR